MKAVITGDVVGSRKVDTHKWMKALKNQLDKFGSSPQKWEIYRGDEFQLEINHPEEALMAALQLKACMKTFKNLDVRLAIGIGEREYKGSKVSQSSGSAFTNSGTRFDMLKKQKINLAISSPKQEFDQEINLMLKLALVIMDSWSVVSAELAQEVFANPDVLQEEIAQKFGIKQAAVSQRANRAKLNLIRELENYYKSKFLKILQV